MSSARTGLAVMATVALAAVASAQRPDFSGRWQMDIDASSMPAAVRAKAGSLNAVMVVKQTDSAISHEALVDGKPRLVAGKPLVITYYRHSHDRDLVTRRGCADGRKNGRQYHRA